MTNGNLNEVFASAGVNPDYEMTSDELVNLFLPASIEAFGDGELLILHELIDDPELQYKYGKTLFKNGIVSPSLNAAALLNGMEPGTLVDFQRYAADYFLEGRDQIINFMLKSSITIKSDAVELDNIRVALKRKPELVVDYGPGVAGLAHTRAQADIINRRGEPFRYYPITRLPFTNAVLMNSYKLWFGRPDVVDKLVEKQYYLGREDGIKSATDEFVRSQVEHEGHSEIADLILASGLYAADKSEVKAGITNSHKLLHEGGALIVRSLAKPSFDEIGAEQILAWAYEAGFEEKDTVRFNTLTGGIGAMLLSGVAGRKSISAVLTK